MGAILKREIHAYFSTPLGYVFLAVFYFFSGFYFFAGVLYQNSTDLSVVFESMFMIIMLLVPILTMRLFSEDYKTGTDQLLLTSPVSVSGLVYGKFFAAYAVFAIGAAVMVVYALVMALFAPLAWFSIIGNLIGLLLLGGALVSIGLFVSALTQNQVVAAAGAFGVILFFMYLDTFSSIIPISWLETLFTQLSFMGRYRDFTSGLINIADIIYFFSVMVMFNFFTIRIVEKKRWS